METETEKIIINVYLALKNSINETARYTGLSRLKVRRTLLSAGIDLGNPLTTQIQKMYNSGMSVTDIAQELKICTMTVTYHLPYKRSGNNSPKKNNTMCPVCNSYFMTGEKECCITARREYRKKRNQELKEKNLCIGCGKKAGINPKTGRYYTLCEACIKKRKEYNKSPKGQEVLKKTYEKYKLENEKKIDEYHSEYRLKNKERIAAYCREYYKKNKEKILQKTSEYYKNKPTRPK